LHFSSNNLDWITNNTSN